MKFFLFLSFFFSGFLSVFLLSESGFAGPDPFIQVSELSLKENPSHPSVLDEYLVANERFPEDALKAYQSAPEGVYVSVGTERGFIGASNGGRVTHLLLVDFNPKIVIYNRVNIALLKLAKDREHYLHLRQKASLEEWLRLSREQGLTDSDRQLMEEFFKQWRALSESNQNDSSGSPGIEVDAPVKGQGFKGVNYLFDDALFSHLKEMADAGRIVSHWGDLSSDERMEEIVIALDKAKLSLSVLDLSNAWHGTYIKEVHLARTLKTFDVLAKKKSLLITTDSYPLLNHFFGDRWLWTYSAYTFEKIRSKASWRGFVRSLYHNRIPPFYWKLRIFGWQMPGRSCEGFLVKRVEP